VTAEDSPIYHSIVFSYHSIVEIVLWQQNQPTKKPVEEIPVQPKMSKATKRFGSDPHYFERLQDNYVQSTKGDEPRVSEKRRRGDRVHPSAYGFLNPVPPRRRRVR
jgi:hypothetical protein